MIVDLPDELRESGAIEVRKKFGTISGGDILDVGTHDGEFIKVLMKVLRDYDSFTGIDISEDDVKNGEQQFKKAPVHFKVMNAEEMTFQDDQFDTVCISYSIHHLENIDGVLSEMYRVLKPGGFLIIQELYSDGEQTTAQIVDKKRIGLKDVEVYESSWSVKCLFCDDAHECQYPKREENIDVVLKEIDDDLERVRKHQAYRQLREEAESIKERVRAVGSSAASVMYFFGMKKSE